MNERHMHRILDKGKGLVDEVARVPSSIKARDFTKPVEEKKRELATMQLPEHFSQIGGNSNPSNAKVIFIAEMHSYNHFKDNLAVLEKFASTGDILLIEGHASMEPITTQGWLTSGDMRYGREPVTLSKQIDVYGWDNLKANYDQSQMYKLERTLAKEMQKARDTRNMPNLYRLTTFNDAIQKRAEVYSKQRDQSLLTTLDLAVNTLNTESKIFIIAGRMHYTHNQEVQEAIAKYSSIVFQTTRLMNEDNTKQYSANRE